MSLRARAPFPLSALALAVFSSQAHAQSSCFAGTFDAPPLDGICLDAAEGTYVPNDGATFALIAPLGTFVATTGATAPTPAPVGRFVPITGSNQAFDAPLGTFVNTTGATAPTDAPPGSYVDVTGATAPTLASPGTFVDTSGATAPTQASPGTFVDTFGATTATPAPPGKFVDTFGATSATLAPPGTFVENFGATTATLASPGTFVDTFGATAATSAPPGTFVDGFGADSATPAPLGTFVDTFGATAPTVAPIGTFVNVEGATGATACEAGGSTPTTGSVACRDSSQTFDNPNFVSPEFDLAGAVGSEIDLTTNNLDPFSVSFEILNLSNDLGTPQPLTDLTILDIVMGSNGGLFSLDSGATDTFGNFIPQVVSTGGGGFSFNIDVTPAAFGQFTTQLDILTDQSSELGVLGDIFSFNLNLNVSSVPTPPLFALFLSALGLLGWKQRR